MGTLKQKLDYLKITKDEIKKAIISRGLAINDEDSFRSYVDKIRSIPTDFITPDGVKFNGSTMVEIPMMDTSRMTSMQELFDMCSYLKIVPSLDCTNVTNMTHIFNGCASLEKLPRLESSKVTFFVNAFSNCPLLKKIEYVDFSCIEVFDDIFTGSTNIAYLEIMNLGKSETVSEYDFSMLENWGDGSMAKGAEQSVINTFGKNLYDRRNNNMPDVTLKISGMTDSVFDESMYTSVSKKGYTLM